ncbi:MAG TPA: hypothetical protein VGE97_02145 [Nitrososphaera sp.]
MRDGELVRFGTAAILSLVLIAGMFIFPAVVLHTLLPSLKQNIHNPLPRYEMALLWGASFCMTWRFLIALPLAAVLFTIAALSDSRAVRKK